MRKCIWFIFPHSLTFIWHLFSLISIQLIHCLRCVAHHCHQFRRLQRPDLLAVAEQQAPGPPGRERVAFDDGPLVVFQNLNTLLAQAQAEAGMTCQHGRNPVADFDACPLAQTRREAVVLRAHAVGADAVYPIIEKGIEVPHKGAKVPVPIAILQFVWLDMLVPDRFSLPALRQRRISEGDIGSIFQRLVELEDRLLMLAVVNDGRERQRYRARAALPLALHELMASFAKEPLPALEEAPYGPSIGRPRREAFLQRNEGARLVLIDIDGKEGLRQAKGHSPPVIGDGKAFEAPLTFTPFVKAGIIGSGQRLNGQAGERFKVPIQSRNGRRAVERGKMLDEFVTRKRSGPVRMKKDRQQYRS